MDQTPVSASRRSIAPGHKTSFLIVLVLLALPVFYVVARHKSPTRDLQANASQQDGGSVLAPLESLAKSNPTSAHRLNLSQAYINNKMFGQAIDVLTPLVAEEPKNAAAWNNLCVARTLQSEFNLAIDACQQGIRSDGSFQLLRNNLRWAEGERDKTIAALAEQEKTVPENRNSAFYVSEGLNQLHLGYYDQAITAWQRAIQLDPGSAVAWNDLGTAQMMQHHYGEARNSFLKANALDPANQLVHNNLAWAEDALKVVHPQP